MENKTPSVSSLIKKTDYDTKISALEKKLTDHNHDKYITTPEFNNLAAAFNARLAQANLITKTDFDAKLSSLNRNITSNKTKHLLLENEFKKLKIFISSCFRNKIHFEEDRTQNYWVFQPMTRYLRVGASRWAFINTKKIYSIKSLHYNGVNIYLFVNCLEIIKFKAKDSKIVAKAIFLGTTSIDWSIDDIKRTGLRGYVYVLVSTMILLQFMIF